MAVLVVNCPHCGHPVNWKPESLFRPFCSERCKNRDFGEWVFEEKIIPGESLLAHDETDDQEQS
jgi:endogenous inhibitor of DNA gyrase (YacG/DUF329 family)